MTRRGFTLIELMTVVLLIGIILALAVPNYVNARQKSRRLVCTRNLAKIDMAKEEWALATRASTGSPVTMNDLVPGHLKKTPACPAGGDYTPQPVGTNPTCSLGGDHTL